MFKRIFTKLRVYTGTQLLMEIEYLNSFEHMKVSLQISDKMEALFYLNNLSNFNNQQDYLWSYGWWGMYGGIRQLSKPQ